jgi:hypothetical protein
MKLTKKRAIDFFRIAYWELARTGKNLKSTIKTINISQFLNECSLCEYVCQQLSSEGYCDPSDYIGFDKDYCVKICPVIWPVNYNGDSICWSWNGLFTEWSMCLNIEKRKELAKQISELPEK